MFVAVWTSAVEHKVRAAPRSLWPPRLLTVSGQAKGRLMNSDAFRSTATWLAALFVGTMFVAASTSFAGLA
jgi:hypothetical protein